MNQNIKTCFKGNICDETSMTSSYTKGKFPLTSVQDQSPTAKLLLWLWDCFVDLPFENEKSSRTARKAPNKQLTSCTQRTTQP